MSCSCIEGEKGLIPMMLLRSRHLRESRQGSTKSCEACQVSKNAGNTRRIASEKAPTASAPPSSHSWSWISASSQNVFRMRRQEGPQDRGCSNEMWRVCFDDNAVLQLLLRAAEDFSRADVPDGTRVAFMSATIRALQKPDDEGALSSASRATITA